MILSTVPENGYDRMQGTSMACPHVSGVAALIASEFGGPGFTREDLIDRLLKTATGIGLPADEMFFIDDSQANVDASIAAGLPAVYYKPGTDLDALIASVL